MSENSEFIKEIDAKLSGAKVSAVTTSKKVEGASIKKLIISAIVIPLMNAFGLILDNYISSGVWVWTTILVTINIITIPAISAWLADVYNVKEKKLTADYEKQLKQKEDALNGYKIKAGLYEYALEKNSIPKPDVSKYINFED